MAPGKLRRSFPIIGTPRGCALLNRVQVVTTNDIAYRLLRCLYSVLCGSVGRMRVRPRPRDVGHASPAARVAAQFRNGFL